MVKILKLRIVDVNFGQKPGENKLPLFFNWFPPDTQPLIVVANGKDILINMKEFNPPLGGSSKKRRCTEAIIFTGEFSFSNQEYEQLTNHSLESIQSKTTEIYEIFKIAR